MKKTLLSLFAAFAMAATASAQVTFTCTAGQDFGTAEGCDKAFDGNNNTKWCKGTGDNAYALVTASAPVYLWAYEFQTANDNAQYNYRCPQEWAVYGTNDEAVAADANAEGWVSLDSRNEATIDNKNFTAWRFYCSGTPTVAYKYFKVHISKNRGAGIQQTSEFRFIATAAPCFTSYNWVDGTNTDLKKMFDHKTSTKAEGGQMPDNCFVILETADGKPHSVKEYALSTHDDGSWADRAPKSWKLEGSNDQTNWVTIDDVTNGGIENINYYTKNFRPANSTGAFRYVKMTFRNFKGGYHQCSEFFVNPGCEVHTWVAGEIQEATCVDAGGTNYTCSVCGATKFEMDIEPTGIHTYADGYCTVCHCPDPSFMTAVDGFYLPTTVAEFNWLAAMIQSDAAVNIKLTQDVDLADFAGFGNGTEIVPFKGEFDGQGHWLTNIRIEASVKNVGLFGMVEDANIHDLGLDKAYVKATWGNPNAGGIAGNAKNSTFNRIAVVKDSYVEGYDHVGAIVGNTEGNTVVSNCLADITVLSGAYQAGGLVGTSNGLTLEKSLFTGEVRNNNYNSSGLVALIDGTGAPTTLRNNISAASKIWVGQDNGLYSLINTGGRSATYENNQVASEIVYAKGNPEETVSKTLTNPDDSNGKQTATRDMQCKSFLTETMGWDMTNDWKMVAAGQWPVLAWMEAEAAQTVAITEAGYATFVAEAELEIPEGVAVYAAQTNGEYIHLEPITGSIPAGEAVVVKGTGSVELPYAVEYADEVENNELVAATAEVAADGTQYVLAQPEGEKVGFYQATTGNIAAGKGYIESTAGIKAFYFEKENATAISSAAAEAENAVIYNIAGQRIQKMQKGINVVNGMKVLK